LPGAGSVEASEASSFFSPFICSLIKFSQSFSCYFCVGFVQRSERRIQMGALLWEKGVCLCGRAGEGKRGTQTDEMRVKEKRGAEVGRDVPHPLTLSQQPERAHCPSACACPHARLTRHTIPVHPHAKDSHFAPGCYSGGAGRGEEIQREEESGRAAMSLIPTARMRRPASATVSFVLDLNV